MSDQLRAHLEEKLDQAHRERASALDQLAQMQKGRDSAIALSHNGSEAVKARDSALVKLSAAENAAAAARRAQEKAEREARAARSEAEEQKRIADALPARVEHLEGLAQRIRLTLDQKEG